MGYNNIQNGLQGDVRAYAAPGAQRLILIPQEDVLALQVLSGDTVERITLAPGKKYHLFDNLDELSYALTTTSTKSGSLYGIELGFTAAVHTIQKNTLFNQLLDTKVVAILEDNNFNWWLLGHEQPFVVPSTEARIDNDTNGYTIKLSTKQRETIYRMSTAWVKTINTLPFSDLVDGTGLGDVQVVITVPAGGTGGTVITTGSTGTIIVAPSRRKIVTAPVNNYVVAAGVGGVLAIGGRTVKLPPAPQEGDDIIIKDYRGIAATLPIIIQGNGYPILLDDTLNDRILINTNAGSLTLLFAANCWHHYAFTS